MLKIFSIVSILSILLLLGCTSVKRMVSCTYIEEKRACCKGKVCSQTDIMCENGYEPKFVECDENCIPQWICKPIELP